MYIKLIRVIVGALSSSSLAAFACASMAYAMMPYNIYHCLFIFPYAAHLLALSETLKII